MTTNKYPFNLVRAIFGDKPNEDANANTVYLKGLYEQLGELTADEQRIIKLRFEDGLTYQACSEALGVSLENARSTVAKIMRKLRAHTRNIKFKGVPVYDLTRSELENERLRDENQRLKTAMQAFDESGINPLHIARMATIIQPERLETPVYRLGLNSRTLNRLAALSIKTIQDVLSTPTADFDNLSGFGVKSREDLYAAIREHLMLPERTLESHRKENDLND